MRNSLLIIFYFRLDWLPECGFVKEGHGWKKMGDSRLQHVDKFVERVQTCTESAFYNSGSHVSS